MKNFLEYITEASTGAGIQHLEHPSDRTFDGPKAATHAVRTLRAALRGSAPITRKIDDKMSYQAIRTPEGKVGVKYKGPGASYNFSEKDIEKQHGHKPYLAGPLKALHKHLSKVLPNRPGEYQGGFMSTPETRETSGGHISHTPNTIEYKTPANSAEGKKLARSKVSTVIHTELKGKDKKPHPITDDSEFSHHPDVHRVSHVVSGAERNIKPEDKKIVDQHLRAATKLMKGHSYEHMAGHEITMRTYINSTVSSGEKPSTRGYATWLASHHDKKIDSVKTQKAKDEKRATKEAALQHVKKNATAFNRSLQIHHHVQQATNHLARALDSHGAGGFETHIGGNKAGGEGYVAGGTSPIKIVDREGFSKANRARSEMLRASRVTKK